MRFLHLTWLAAGMAALLAGCAGSDAESTDAMGTARIQLITPQAFDFQLTRVSVETNTGFTVNLARDPQSGAFTGSLSLPVGVHEVIGRAFVDAAQVGASNPVPAEIQAGAVAQVMIQILDTTGGDQPDFGPLLESLSHPASTTVGTAVLLAASVIDPDGTPVSIQWSDDCDDASFTSPQDGVTGWSKAAPGTCRITLTGTSNGQSLTTSFSVVVFEAGANQGAVEVISEFISAPSVDVQLSLPDGFCLVNRFASNASCSSAIASPTAASVQGFVSWENSTPGTSTIFDDCGGAFSVSSNQFFIDTTWLPPVQGGICRVTVRAVSQEGVVSEMSAAVLVRPGSPRQPAVGPFVNVDLFLPGGVLCRTASDQGEVDCGITQRGLGADLSGFVSWGDSVPGSIEITDSCGGVFSTGHVDVRNGQLFGRWQAPAAPAPSCRITVTGTSLEGVIRSAVLRIDVQ